MCLVNKNQIFNPILAFIYSFFHFRVPLQPSRKQPPNDYFATIEMRLEIRSTSLGGHHLYLYFCLSVPNFVCVFCSPPLFVRFLRPHCALILFIPPLLRTFCSPLSCLCLSLVTTRIRMQIHCMLDIGEVGVPAHLPQFIGTDEIG